jgi:hypothetical protein
MTDRSLSSTIPLPQPGAKYVRALLGHPTVRVVQASPEWVTVQFLNAKNYDSSRVNDLVDYRLHVFRKMFTLSLDNTGR